MSNDLFTTDATGATRSATADEILDAARAILAHRVRRGAAISNPRHTRDYLRLHLAPHEHEIFAILFLDNRHRVIEFVPLFRGTVDGASVYPREVVKEALRRNAAAVILAHNHPSGVAEPSQADELITTRIRDALALVDIRVLDHLVVTGDTIVSFAERGLL
jgi:DNA repair protein RadC